MFYIVIFIAIAIASYMVQANLQRKFKRYSQVAVSAGLTGREVAEKCYATTALPTYRSFLPPDN